MRKGRYKKNFLTPEQCPEFAREFSKALPTLESFDSQAAFVAEYVFRGLKILKPKEWKGARLPRTLFPQVPDKSLQVFSEFSLRGIPLSVNRSLIYWSMGQYPLKLFLEVPSTETILQMQSEGIRCVTCLLKPEELAQYVLNERDPLSFTLHDLIHADHFFRDSRQAKVQIGFSRWMLSLWSSSLAKDYFTQDKSFEKAIEYACSDMNTVGVHLIKYLKAILCRHQKDKGCEDILALGGFSKNFQMCFNTLNTPQEDSRGLYHMEEELFQKGSH